jgi:hypothetical protein
VSYANPLKLMQEGCFDGTEILRQACGACWLRGEAEVTDVLAKRADLKAGTNRQRLVRHCYLPRRLGRDGELVSL